MPMFLSSDELNSYKSIDDIPNGSKFYLGCTLVQMVDLVSFRTIIPVLNTFQKGCKPCVDCHHFGNKNLLTED